MLGEMNANACVLVIRLHLLLDTGLVVGFQGWRGPEVIWSCPLALAEAAPQRSGRAEACHCGAGRFSSLFSPTWTPAFSSLASLTLFFSLSSSWVLTACSCLVHPVVPGDRTAQVC